MGRILKVALVVLLMVASIATERPDSGATSAEKAQDGGGVQTGVPDSESTEEPADRRQAQQAQDDQEQRGQNVDAAPKATEEDIDVEDDKEPMVNDAEVEEEVTDTETDTEESIVTVNDQITPPTEDEDDLVDVEDEVVLLADQAAEENAEFTEGDLGDDNIDKITMEGSLDDEMDIEEDDEEVTVMAVEDVDEVQQIDPIVIEEIVEEPIDNIPVLPSTDELETKEEADSQPPRRQRKPNIVILLADDVGMGDLGCFGNLTLRTPNIDRLAEDGVRLTQNLAAAAVCTPSRAALLTGRYPVRSGMAPSNIVRVNIFVSSTGGLPPNEITLAELAKEQGYATGYIGKWHLGVHCGTEDFCHHPNRQGFDHFYGLPLSNLKDFGDDDGTVTKSAFPNIDYLLAATAILGVLTAILFRKVLGLVLTILLLLLSILVPALTYWMYNNMTIFNAILMRNLDVVEQPLRLNNRLAARMASEAGEFIAEQARNDKPFLLVVGWIQVHTALHTSPEFTGVSAHGKYGDNVEEMDWSVGQVLNALEEHDLADDTLVYFASDNGAHNEERGADGSIEGGFNGIYKGGKAMGGMEGGVRVPGVVRFPGRLPAGRVLHQAVSLMDVYTTAARLIGADVPADRAVDGVDILPLLAGETEAPPHEFLFHYCGLAVHAARYSPNDGTGDVWKVHYATPVWEPGTENCRFICGCYGNSVTWHNPPLLYNLARDPSEDSPLDATDPHHAAVLDTIRNALNQHEASVQPVDDQMAPLKLLPVPALQPCCGGGRFPNCDCAEPDV